MTVVVPKAYNLTRGYGVQVAIPAGTQEMAEEDANHWFSKAMGVTRYVK